MFDIHIDGSACFVEMAAVFLVCFFGITTIVRPCRIRNIERFLIKGILKILNGAEISDRFASAERIVTRNITGDLAVGFFAVVLIPADHNIVQRQARSILNITCNIQVCGKQRHF